MKAPALTIMQAHAILVSVATGETKHLYRGSCPDAAEGFGARDSGCPVCAALMALSRKPGTAQLTAEFEKINQQPQRQDGVVDQLRDLRPFANRLGLYDAADFIGLSIDKGRS